MSEKSALRPYVVPGEYPCVWLLPVFGSDAARVHGFVTLDGGQRPVGYGYGPEVPFEGETFPQFEQHRAITCELSSGQVATFVDATVITEFPERVRVSGLLALVGFTSPASPAAEICTARVQITGQDAVTGFAPLSRAIFLPKTPGDRVRYELGAREEATIQWQDASAQVVSDFAAASATSDLYKVDHRFSPHLTVDVDEPVPIGTFINDWIDPLRALIALSTSESQDITMMTVTGEDNTGNDGQWAVYQGAITQRTYNSDGTVLFDTRSALKLGPDGDSLLMLIRKWVQLRDALHPIILTFGRQAGLTSTLTPQAAFQALVQAIEGAYRFENPNAIAAADDAHLRKRDHVLGLLQDTSATSRQRRYVKSSMGNYAPGNLNTALEWLDASVPGSLADEAAGLRLVKAQVERGTWADGLRKIRNDIAHGNTAFPPAQLREVVWVLQRFTTALALAILGAGPKAQERALWKP